jgi:hypothetical protein
VPDPLASWDVGLVWRHDEQNPAVIRFLDTARNLFPGEPNQRGEGRIPSLTTDRHG